MSLLLVSLSTETTRFLVSFSSSVSSTSLFLGSKTPAVYFFPGGNADLTISVRKPFSGRLPVDIAADAFVDCY